MTKITLDDIYNELVDLRKDIDNLKQSLKSDTKVLEMKNPDDKLTSKQLWLLQRAKEEGVYKGSLDLTKRQASETISKLKEQYS